MNDIQKMKESDNMNPIIMDRYTQLNKLNQEIYNKQHEEKKRIDEEWLRELKRKESIEDEDRKYREEHRKLKLEYEQKELQDLERKRKFHMEMDEKVEKEIARNRVAMLEDEAYERRRMEERRRLRERSEERMLEKEKEMLHMQEMQKDHIMLRREKVLDLQHNRDREKKDDLLRVLGMTKNVRIKDLDFNN
jgi:hypothetical protein